MSNSSQVEAVFFAALEHDTANERAAYLEGACRGNAELRRQVEKLLQAHPKLGNFLNSAAAHQLTDSAPRSDVTEELGAKSAGRPQSAPLNPSETAETTGDDDGSLEFLQPSTRPDSLGRIGHYEVLEVLGKGGFGIVFRAFDEVLQRVVAVKVMAPHLAATSPARKRFLREARSYAKVRHENIVQVYAVEEQPLPYLVMEYIPGETLQQRIARKGPLDATETVKIGCQLAEGLAAAHETGLIHRDIKPGNILIEAGAQHRVKITDFGLARAADDASATQSGVVAGTPMYMAPEQAKGETLDHRADLFSLGSVLYTMCSGRPPFRANNTLAVLKRVAEDTPRPIPEIIPEVPRWLCAIIARLQAKNPADRFASAREVAELLAGGQTASLPAIPEPAESLPVTRQIRQTGSLPHGKRRWAAAAAVLVLGLVGLGFTEATGVTNMRGTVIRFFSPEGTLVVEVDDPAVSVTIDGADMVITGTGAKEIRLKPGNYKVQASKDGKVLHKELVTVAKNGRQIVQIRLEPSEAAAVVAAPPVAKLPATEWEKSVARLSEEEQVKAVLARLKERNNEFAGAVERSVETGPIVRLVISGSGIQDLSPVRGLSALAWLESRNSNTTLTDLTPLRGLELSQLVLHDSSVSDLSPLMGMKLAHLDLTLAKKLTELAPLRGMPLTMLNLPYTQVHDLTPLQNMDLHYLNCAGAPVADLAPLRGMPLKHLFLVGTSVADLKPLAGAPLELLDCAKTQISDLTPLKGTTQLRELFVQDTMVKDLTPLKQLPLKVLNCSNTQVADLTPLRGMKLTQLYCDATKAPDLTALQGMPLEVLNCRGYDLTLEVNKSVLRSLKNLATINSTPIAEFWKELNQK